MKIQSKLYLLGLLILTSYLVHFLGFFEKTVEFQQNYSDCKYLEGNFSLYGTEDSVVYNKDIIIGIHTGIHKIFTTNIIVDDLERGGFFAIYGIATGNLKVKQVKVNNHPKNLFFNPHGISFRQNKLYSINHSYHTGGERVESYDIVFNQEGEIELNYLHATIMDSSLNGITNDIEFLTENRFIITQWQIFPIPLKGNSEQSIWKIVGTIIAQAFKLKFTYAYDCHYVKNSNAQCKIIEDSKGVVINGISYDGDKTIAITDTLDRNIQFYQLDDKQELKLTQTLQSKAMIDNISYDSEQKLFIGSGSNTVIEYLTVNNKLEAIISNKQNKSVVNYSALVETIKLNKKTNTYESELLFSSSNSVATLSGALIDHQQKYLFLNNFSDKSIAVCTKNSSSQKK